MRQICPHCLKSVEVPESAAGSEFDCPACGQPFPVPKPYAPNVYALSPPPTPPAVPPTTWAEPVADRPAPPPGYVPPAPPPTPAEGGGLLGELRTHALPLAPGVMAWVPAASLTLALVLTFFPWVGAYPGGYRVFSQTPWGAGVGAVSPTATAVPQELQDAEPKLRQNLTPSNLALLLYCILLIPAVIVAWAERLMPNPPAAASVHRRVSWVTEVWPHLLSLLLGLSVLLLMIVLYQGWRGFGLETAVERYATDRHAEELKAADTTAKQQVADIQVGMDAARFAVQTTTAYDLAVLAHVTVTLAVLGRLWLSRRGAKPAPRIALQY